MFLSLFFVFDTYRRSYLYFTATVFYLAGVPGDHEQLRRLVPGLRLRRVGGRHQQLVQPLQGLADILRQLAQADLRVRFLIFFNLMKTRPHRTRSANPASIFLKINVKVVIQIVTVSSLMCRLRLC